MCEVLVFIRIRQGSNKSLSRLRPWAFAASRGNFFVGCFAVRRSLIIPLTAHRLRYHPPARFPSRKVCAFFSRLGHHLPRLSRLRRHSLSAGLPGQNCV